MSEERPVSMALHTHFVSLATLKGNLSEQIESILILVVDIVVGIFVDVGRATESSLHMKMISMIQRVENGTMEIAFRTVTFYTTVMQVIQKCVST